MSSSVPEIGVVVTSARAGAARASAASGSNRVFMAILLMIRPMIGEMR
jgi:hypothetical protein